MITSINVNLAGREYEIQKKQIRAHREYRDKLDEPFAEVAAALKGAAAIDLSNGVDTAMLLSVISGTLIHSVDILLDLLFEYSPELTADREHIEENAYDEEALAVFSEVLKLVYPFGQLLGLVTGKAASKT